MRPGISVYRLVAPDWSDGGGRVASGELTLTCQSPYSQTTLLEIDGRNVRHRCWADDGTGVTVSSIPAGGFAVEASGTIRWAFQHQAGDDFTNSDGS